MERRTFIATTGTGIGIGVGGCLDSGGTADEGDETTAINDGDIDTEGSTVPATFEVASMSTNSPVEGGELLVVEATIENVGDEEGTTDVDLVVGHDPSIEDSEMLTLEAGETADLTLEFQAGQPAGDSESFPACVDTGAHESCQTVTVE